ncbi:MAG TPA: response regulator [Vicinamibacterales bacterium]|nr:response regulator [Vicinamibacterales bacterium]
MTEKIDILLVEDNADDIELAVHALREEKLANGITIARDGEEALDIIFHRSGDADTAPPRLILLDLKLPKIDGLEVLRVVKNDPRTKAIPIVVMTSSKEERDLVESYKLGVNAYVQKPVGFDAFRSIVKELGLFWLVINQTPSPQAFGA